jgi:DeoR/GlpR family transcriptional regulator of sugar metabolism
VLENKSGSDVNFIGNKRQIKIAEIVNQLGSVRVSDLSKRFDVTEETIRRDLEKLESERVLSRIHGGAVPAQKGHFEIPIIRKPSTFIEEKKLIAKKAASLVEDGDIIALDASSTCFQMAKHLIDKEITVITNSIPVTLELANRSGLTVILVGGYLREISMSLVGISTELTIEGYHVDKFFFSAKGFDLRRGISEDHELQAQVKRKFISISDQQIFLADHSKFGVKSLVQITDLNNIKLITDNKLAVDKLRKLKERGIEIEIAN